MDSIAARTNMTPIEVLLKIEEDGTVRARNVYDFLEMNPGNYARWCKSNIADNEFAEENVDFKAFFMNEEWGGQATTDYKLSISFAKKLCMKAGGERGEEARDYFVKAEEDNRDVRLALNSLSPQLQYLIGMEIKQNEMEKRLALTDKKVDDVNASVAAIKETIVAPLDDWRRKINEILNKIVESSEAKDYQAVRTYTYETLEARAHCRLNERLKNMRERKALAGATKTAIQSTIKLDCIEEDVRLKEIYTAIVRELAVKYGVAKTSA